MKNIRFVRSTNVTAIAGRRSPAGRAVSPGRRLRCLLVFVVPLFLPAGVLATYISSSVANPIGPPNVPPSSYQSSAVRTPGATSDSGNLIVTGNVSGARQFRAPVPYQSPTRFQGTLGSTSLDSFLRASAVPESGGYSRPSGTFYSPTGTVAKIGAARTADSAPLMQASAMNATPVVQPRVAPATPVTDWRMWEQLGNRSASSPSLQTWKALSSGSAPAPVERRASQRPRETVMPEDTFRQLESTPANRPALELTPTTTGNGQTAEGRTILGTPVRGDPFPERLESQNAEWPGQTPLKPTEPSRSNDAVAASRPQAPETGSRDSTVLTRGLRTRPTAAIGDERGLAGVARPNGIDSVFPPDAPKPGATNDIKTSDALSSFRRVEKTARQLDTSSNLLQRSSGERAGRPVGSATSPGNVAGDAPNSYRSANGITWVGRASDGPAPSRTDPSSPGRVSVRAPNAFTRALTTHPTTADSPVAPSAGIDPLSEIQNRQHGTSDFERHMHAARSFVQQGRYYHAAESFTRASAYEPGNAIPHLGRSIALFAAGEYVTSSLCLARALELNPQSALTQAHIIKAAGGPARFEQRRADLEQCLKDSNAPQLQFLLAYVYHHMGRAQEAARAVEAAQKAMPSSVAVDILKAAIGS